MENHITELLKKLYYDTFNTTPENITAITGSGSNRKYYRLGGKSNTVIGVYNSDKKENSAFIYLSHHFSDKDLPVANVLATDLSNGIYLLEDLGDTDLFSIISQRYNNNEVNENSIDLYKKSLSYLIKFQIQGIEGLDTKMCYPRGSFDRQSILWDLNYFKYYFAKLTHVDFDEQKLEDDFNTFADLLLDTDTDFFMYRDFQSRNIMIKNGNPYFIDFQGGRKGALQYDIASLLYDAKADVPQEIRNELLDYYITELSKYTKIDETEFKEYFYAYVIIRIMQAMGAYGFRGFYEKKTSFLQSIPFALKNLEWLLNNIKLKVEVPTLWNVLNLLISSDKLKKFGNKQFTITINSFSYKKGIPKDNSGNGGGFVFDCRALPNPGRYEEYKTMTGKDNTVIEFFEKRQVVADFIDKISSIVDISIENYIQRKFSHLLLNFGCTGGQHRSVYCAEQVLKNIAGKFDINVILTHTEENNWMR